MGSKTNSASDYTLNFFCSWVPARNCRLFYTPNWRANPTKKSLNFFWQRHPLSKKKTEPFPMVAVARIIILCRMFKIGRGVWSHWGIGHESWCFKQMGVRILPVLRFDLVHFSAVKGGSSILSLVYHAFLCCTQWMDKHSWLSVFMLGKDDGNYITSLRPVGGFKRFKFYFWNHTWDDGLKWSSTCLWWVKTC
jgi:hypothetical protein